MFADLANIGGCPREWEWNPHTAAHQDSQVVHQTVDGPNSAKNPPYRPGFGILKRGSLQHLTRNSDDIERIADFMSENTKENVAVAFRSIRITPYYLGDRLVDGLVKPGYVSKERIIGCRPALHPQKQDTRPESAVFGNRLFEIESRIQPHACV